MNDESNAWVDEALAALAASDAHLAPPPHVEAAVLRQWDEQPVRGKPVHRWLVWALVPPAVGVLVTVVVLQRGSVTTSEPDRPAPVEHAAPVAAAAVTSPAAIPPVEAAVAAPLPRPVAAVPRRPLPVPVTDAGYVIVPDPLVDPTTLRVVRVRMSRMALATLGMPLVNPDADSLVEVEMLVGDEGVAQSIRRATLVSD